MEYIGLHPYKSEYRMAKTLEDLANQFSESYSIVGLYGVDVYEVPDRPCRVEMRLSLVKPSEAPDYKPSEAWPFKPKVD